MPSLIGFEESCSYFLSSIPGHSFSVSYAGSSSSPWLSYTPVLQGSVLFLLISSIHLLLSVIPYILMVLNIIYVPMSCKYTLLPRSCFWTPSSFIQLHINNISRLVENSGLTYSKLNTWFLFSQPHTPCKPSSLPKIILWVNHSFFQVSLWLPHHSISQDKTLRVILDALFLLYPISNLLGSDVGSISRYT